MAPSSRAPVSCLDSGTREPKMEDTVEDRESSDPDDDGGGCWPSHRPGLRMAALPEALAEEPPPLRPKLHFPPSTPFFDPLF